MPIKIRFAKTDTKPSAVATAAYWTALGACLIYTATVLTTLITTSIDPDIMKSEAGSTLSRLIQLGLAIATLGSLAAFALALIALVQPNHPRPRTHAWSAAILSIIMLTVTACLLLFAWLA